MDNTSHLNNSVKVQIVLGSNPISEFNLNKVVIYSSTRLTGKFDSYNRIVEFFNANEVGDFFGANSKEKSYADVIFGNTRNPVSGGGSVSFAYWRSSSETQAATAGKLTGEQLSEAVVIPQLQGITNGSFIAVIDGTDVIGQTLDFTNVETILDIATILNTALSAKATVSVKNNSIVITSKTTGVTSSVAKFEALGTGTDISELLGLGIKSTKADGKASATLTAETKLDVYSQLIATYGGHTFMDYLTDQERNDIASAATSSIGLFYALTNDKSQLATNNASAEYQITKKNLTSFRTIYSTDERAAAALMGLMHSVVMNLEASTITVEKKQFAGIEPDEFTQSEIKKAILAGVDLYANTKGQGYVVGSGGRQHLDTIYNRLSFAEAVKVQIFNTLATTGTKIPNTPKGQAIVYDTIDSVCRKYVRNGYIGLGLKWIGQVPFMQSQPELFNKRLKENGFVIQVGDYDNQTLEERLERDCPPFQVAIKEAGAIHIVFVSVNPQI
ncbi:MAG: DUF3383 domain-containing protein [Campylobacteraceae bacterium]|jgi:hypothetical protein|nr:DUF3383 domain-containing protein [Campylobacteraceae bacterium]